MRNCEIKCVANIGGKCAVESCDGYILAFDAKRSTTLEEAADQYNFFRELIGGEKPKQGNECK